MVKKLQAFAAILVSWFVLDALGHGLAFASWYAASSEVWRPRNEMKVGVIYTGVAITAATFVAIYSKLVANKSRRTGLWYGLAFGVANGSSYAFGGYAVHPIPVELAVGWFVLCVIEAVVAGLIVSTFVRE